MQARRRVARMQRSVIRGSSRRNDAPTRRNDKAPNAEMHGVVPSNARHEPSATSSHISKRTPVGCKCTGLRVPTAERCPALHGHRAVSVIAQLLHHLRRYCRQIPCAAQGDAATFPGGLVFGLDDLASVPHPFGKPEAVARAAALLSGHEPSIVK